MGEVHTNERTNERTNMFLWTPDTEHRTPESSFICTRISGRNAPFILGLPAGFPRAHARAHFVRFSCRTRTGSCGSLPFSQNPILPTHIFLKPRNPEVGHRTCSFIRLTSLVISLPLKAFTHLMISLYNYTCNISLSALYFKQLY